MRPIVLGLLGLCVLATAVDAVARPRVGLVLSGGGARGAAHVGALRVLEENRIPVDVIAGTSFGALVGGLYASGLSPDEIEDWIAAFDYVHAANDRPLRRSLSFRRKLDDTSYALRLEVGFRDGEFVLPRGLIGAQELGYQLHVRALHTAAWSDFDEFPIPFRAVATDIERGEPVVLGAGSLADAMLASMAVPGVVAPVEVDGRLLVDGGLVNNLPVDVVRAMGADVVIVVDVATPLATREELEDVVGVSAQVINLIGLEQARAALDSLGAADVLIQPDLSGIGSADFERMDDAIERGVEVGPSVAPRLAPLALDAAAWGDWVAAHRVGAQDLPVISFIDIENPTGVADELVRARMESLQPGDQVTLGRLRRTIDAVYSIGAFERVEFELVERDGQHGLVIGLTPKDLGTDRFRFGLNIEDDFGGASTYNLLVMHDRTQINDLGGEWRTEFQIGDTRRIAGQWFQPLRYRGDWFVSPRVEWRVGGFSSFDGAGHEVARYEVRRDALSLDVGWQWRNIGEVAVTRFQESVRARVDVGDPSLPSVDRAQGGWDWHVVADQLDNWNFPADAWFFTASGRHTPSYAYAETRATGAWELGRERFLLGVRAGARTAGTLPLHERFSIGGFLSLSGLQRDELRGDYLVGARLVWFHHLFQLPTALGDGFYLGLSHERGNVWSTRAAVDIGDLRWGSSAFIGADLVFGALYLGVGRADNGDVGGYLYLQRSFR